MNEWVMIGVPTSAGAHHAGQELAPDALRAAGLADRLLEAGLTVTDAGNLPGAVFAPDRDAPGARNLAAVIRVAADVAGAVAKVVASDRLPLVLGGDCTITIGAVAGLVRCHPDGGLIYVDGDADLGVPGDASSGILDSMGISHLLGRGAPELAGLRGQGPPPEPRPHPILGSDSRGTHDARRAVPDHASSQIPVAPAVPHDTGA